MAMSCSPLARILAFVLVVVAVAPAIQSGEVPSPATAPAPAVDNLTVVCNLTSLPRLCRRILSGYPESQMASIRQLAELSLHITARATTEAAAFIKSQMGAAKEPSPCIKGCAEEIDRYATKFIGLPTQINEDKFYELRESIDDAASAAENRDYQAQCMDAPSPDKAAVWKKIERVRNLLIVTIGLMDAESDRSYAAEEAVETHGR